MAAILPPNDERIRKFLRQAGVDENSPVDPVSRDALLELLSRQDDDETANETSPAGAPVSNEDPIPRPAPTEHITTSFPSLQHPEAMTADDRLLQMMQQQNQMILDLHKRMDYLTELVLVQQNQNQNQNQNNQQQQYEQHKTPREELNRQIDALFEQVRLYEQNPVEETKTTPPPPTQQTPNALPIRRQFFVTQQGHRCYQLNQMFYALRRRLAPNFNFGLVVKVVFILSILFSRLSSRKQTIDDEEWTWHFYRLHVLVVLVVCGFLYQTGMLKVFYIFYVQEDYPLRLLWKGEALGEDLEHEVNAALERYSQRMRRPPRQAPLLPRPGQPPQDEVTGNDNPQAHDDLHPEHHVAGWRETFMGGVIPPAPRNEQEDRGLQFLRDIGFFIGSFFLSILPMWRPEALVAPVQANDGADDGNGLPEVAAPADVLQAADDDEEDE